MKRTLSRGEKECALARRQNTGRSVIKDHNNLGQRSIGVLSPGSTRRSGTNDDVVGTDHDATDVKCFLVVNPDSHDPSVARKVMR